MSVEANKALVRRWLEDVWNSSDLAAIDLLFAPNYTVNDVSYPPAAVKQAVQYLHTAFAPITATIEDLIAEDDKVVVRWSLRGAHSGSFMDLPPTGQLVHLTGINIYRIANNQIVANHEQVNAAEVVQQLRSALATSSADEPATAS